MECLAVVRAGGAAVRLPSGPSAIGPVVVLSSTSLPTLLAPSNDLVAMPPGIPRPSGPRAPHTTSLFVPLLEGALAQAAPQNAWWAGDGDRGVSKDWQALVDLFALGGLGTSAQCAAGGVASRPTSQAQVLVVSRVGAPRPRRVRRGRQRERPPKAGRVDEAPGRRGGLPAPGAGHTADPRPLRKARQGVRDLGRPPEPRPVRASV